MISKRKYPAISIHPTLCDKLQVNWEQDYHNEFSCPECGSSGLRFYRKSSQLCQLNSFCSKCQKLTALTCKVAHYIFGFQPEAVCPNPLCHKVGPDGITKGWIYLWDFKNKRYKCHFCKIIFLPGSNHIASWSNHASTDDIQKFSFESDIWDLRNFYNNPYYRTVNFASITPEWYRYQVKRYIHQILQTKVSRSDVSVFMRVVALRQLGQIIFSHNLGKVQEISRILILVFLDLHKHESAKTLHQKLSYFKSFFEWIGLDTHQLIRSRDIPKTEKNDPDWLDETVRSAIKQNLDKIPAPIARQYLVQQYTAARTADVCQMKIDCLVEDNGQWYVRFYQQKVNRWHQLPANREIRCVIEEQQQWIRQTLGESYPALFCHFRGIHQWTYPEFLGMKPLPEPPKIKVDSNPMIRIIRLLIEQEQILDVNGKTPHFTGKITRSSRLQEIRQKHGMKAAQLYADHQNSQTTFQHYAPPTQEEVAQVDLPFQELLLNLGNRFLPWQSLPESLLKNPKAHELDIEIAPRLVVYGHCVLEPKTPCPYNLYPKCYGCFSFRPSTSKLALYERQYEGEQQRMQEAAHVGAELAYEESKATIEAMEQWLPQLRSRANE